MTPQEGYRLCKEKYPDREPVKCVDYGDCFVYATVIISNEEFSFLSTSAMDSALYVNKNDKKVRIYNPLIQKIDRSQRKEIKIFK